MMEVNKHDADSNCPNYCSTTAMDVETFTHRWILKTVKNIWLSMKVGEELATRKFHDSGKRQTWYVKLKKHEDENKNGFFSIYLYLANSEDEKAVKARAQFCVLDKNNKVVYQSYTVFKEFQSSESYWGFAKFLKANEILDATKGFVVDDQLTMDVRITIAKDVDTYMTASDKVKTAESMSEDYKKLFESSDYYDVVITSETKEFKAHKAILSARSPVFAGMFRTEMTESITGKITIPDFPHHIVKNMLQFLYCGEIENEKENILDTLKLLRIADKYDIKDLFDQCCRIIPSMLTHDNAVETLLEIPDHNPSDLKTTVMKFIAMNKTEVKKTSAFQNMVNEDPELFKELVLTLL